MINSNAYDERSNQLNSYLTNNNFYFRTNEKINNGYLYIKLKENTDNDIFLYWHNSDNNKPYKMSGRLVKSQTLSTPTDTELLFNLKDIPIIRYYDKKNASYNRLQDINSPILQFI